LRTSTPKGVSWLPLVLSFLLVFLLASAGCRKSANETLFLNFDPDSSSGFLSSGWSGWEKTLQGDTFVWCQGRDGKVRVESRADGDRLVRFRCWPFRFAGAPPQTVTFFVNDARVETVGLADDPRVYTMPTPQAVWKKGANELRFSFAYAEAPRDRAPGSSDARTLAAAFDWLEIVRPARTP
jgi:hypothetical protein